MTESVEDSCTEIRRPWNGSLGAEYSNPVGQNGCLWFNDAQEHLLPVDAWRNHFLFIIVRSSNRLREDPSGESSGVIGATSFMQTLFVCWRRIDYYHRSLWLSSIMFIIPWFYRWMNRAMIIIIIYSTIVNISHQYAATKKEPQMNSLPERSESSNKLRWESRAMKAKLFS